MNKKPKYINTNYNFESKIGAGIIDELPLWSAPFGLVLLDEIEYRNNLRVLDIGFGTGFPLVEIAQRLGNDSYVYGIDPWKPSHIRVKQKIDFYGLKNIELIKGEAENIPLEDKSIDLIVSNNGVNNVTDVEKVFRECERVCRTGGQYVASINLNRTFDEFYDVLKDVLRKQGMKEELENVYRHIYEKRKPTATFQRYFTNNGFKIENTIRRVFTMKFADSDALFNHSLIKIGFLPCWESLLKEKDKKKIFAEIRKGLQVIAYKNGNLEMSVPYLIVNARKI